MNEEHFLDTHTRKWAESFKHEIKIKIQCKLEGMTDDGKVYEIERRIVIK